MRRAGFGLRVKASIQLFEAASASVANSEPGAWTRRVSGSLVAEGQHHVDDQAGPNGYLLIPVDGAQLQSTSVSCGRTTSCCPDIRYADAFLMARAGHEIFCSAPFRKPQPHERMASMAWAIRTAALMPMRMTSKRVNNTFASNVWN